METPKFKTDSLTKILIAVIGVLVIGGFGFYLGATYQHSHDNKAVAASTTSQTSTGGQGFGGFRGRFGGVRPVFGQVTAISASSISVNNARSGQNQTFSITSSTTVTNNGQSASVSQIQNGATVAVIADSSNTGQASRILLNPSFGGGGNSNNTTPPANSF